MYNDKNHYIIKSFIDSDYTKNLLIRKSIFNYIFFMSEKIVFV